jgi:negative regulator of flagellin synthesis FlgM
MTTKPITNNPGTQAYAPVNTTNPASSAGTSEIRKPNLAEAAGRLADTVTTGTGADVNLSPEAREKAKAYKKALDIARNTPDVREERVAEIRKRIQDGTYQVDSGKIADGMLMEAIRDKVAQDKA